MSEDHALCNGTKARIFYDVIKYVTVEITIVRTRIIIIIVPEKLTDVPSSARRDDE